MVLRKIYYGIAENLLWYCGKSIMVLRKIYYGIAENLLWYTPRKRPSHRLWRGV
jgi:hypothetical protein